MVKTGESYTTVFAQVMKPGLVFRNDRAGKTKPGFVSIDYAGRAGMSDEKIATKTGRTWQEWAHVLDEDNAAALPHREIAALVHGKHRVGDWWAQTVTVGYERIKGLREIGQRRSGSYEAAKSRTFGVPVSTLFEAWADGTARRKWLGGVDAVVRTATAPKSMRLRWPDGTIIAVNFTAKGRNKSSVALAHTKLRDKVQADEAKTYWTARLDALAAVIA